MSSCYILKLCSRLFVLHCRSRPKYDNSRHFDPHFEEASIARAVKTGDINSVDNYTGKLITLTPVVAKVFECVLLSNCE